MSSRRRVLVVGGGAGGVAVASLIANQTRGRHEVTLVDRRPQHVFQSSQLLVVTRRRTPEAITRPLERLRRFGVRVLRGTVRGIDLDRRHVEVDSQAEPFDYLVIALGLETRPDLVPGFTEATLHPWELDAALRTADALDRLEGGRIVFTLPPGAYRCPPGPYEFQWMVDGYLRERGVRGRTELAFFTPVPEPGEPAATNPVAWMAEQSRRRGIAQHHSFRLRAVDAEKKRLLFESGEDVPYDLYFGIPPHRPARVLTESGLCDEAGMAVDPHTLSTRRENVYAIGDCCNLPALSKAGGVAHQEAEVVAHNIAAELTGRPAEARLRLHTL